MTRYQYSIAIVVVLSLGPTVDAQDRIYVDQYMPLRSELMIADTDGSNPRKLVPGTEIDYNVSFSNDGRWIVFTSERNRVSGYFPGAGGRDSPGAAHRFPRL